MNRCLLPPPLDDGSGCAGGFNIEGNMHDSKFATETSGVERGTYGPDRYGIAL